MKASEFSHLHLKEFPRIQERETSEARFWKALSVVKEVLLSGSPNTLHFDPSHPTSYLATASTKVSLFDASSDKIQRSYSRFTDDAFSGRFRDDGKLIVAGEKTGIVKVFDVQTKSLLRQLRRHTAATRCVRWSNDGLHILSASDDKRALRWDLATEEVLWSSRSHYGDYVRSLDTHPTSSEIFAVGGYDNSVTLWDGRQEQPAWQANHGHPIESMLFAPSGTIVITAGGNEVKMWDVVAGGRLLHTFSNHQKNVTSLAMDGSSSRLLSAGLDGHVKIYNLSALEVVHGMKYHSPILSLAVAPDSRKLLIGFVDGNLMIRNNRKAKQTVLAGPPAELSITDMIDRNLNRVRHHKGAGQVHEFQNVVVAETDRGLRLQPFEKHLKKFSYQKALDAGLETKDPIVVVTLIEELCRRNGLTIALSGRDEVALEPILSFVTKYINHARYNALVIQVAHRVLDMYSCIIGQSESIDELFVRLHRQVSAELLFQKDVKRVIGAVDCVVNVATMPKRPRVEASLETADTAATIVENSSGSM